MRLKYGQDLLVAGTVFTVVGLGLFVFKLLTHPKAEEFFELVGFAGKRVKFKFGILVYPVVRRY